MTEELKQAAQQALMECPFCGSEPHDAHHIEYGRWAVTCRCGAKGASANTGPNATDAAKIKAYSDARTAWNTRALPQQATPEPVGEAGTMPGTSGFTMACFHADKVPVGTKLFARPAPGVPEGFALVPMTEDQVWHNDSIMSANAIGGLKMDAVMRIVRGGEAHHSERLAAAQAKGGGE